MKQLLTTAIMAIALMGTAACNDMSTGKTTGLQSMQVSSIRWDEMAAAGTAAHVTNNGLIMMR